MSTKIKRSGTFTDNMKLPIHRWFRYSAGFSAEWVEQEIIKYQSDTGNDAILLDPFLGSGTTCFAADTLGVKSFGFDGHPFVTRVAKAKSCWHLPAEDFLSHCQSILSLAETYSFNTTRHETNQLLGKCYSPGALQKLDYLKKAYEDLCTNDAVWRLVWLNITSIIRACSHAGTAQWQYVLPNKSKSKVIDPFDGFWAKALLMSEDMNHVQHIGWKPNCKIEELDVRQSIHANKCNLVITSPPYPNNFDYADATRLEMTFWGEIDGWGDLKTAVRPSIMRSCSQHSAGDKVILDELLSSAELEPIKDDIFKVTKALDEIRHTKGGKKAYHTMIAAYFYDLSKIWLNIRNATVDGAKVCFVIGDSAPYGIHVPAEKWLAQIALHHGFKGFSFEKLRDRNVKWKNRTHTVPLHEGRLWVEG
ncbi:hypothetical protein QGN29_05895 [Temperatibacter marinus]|uniref:DNA methylase N-4/N-6 domain-containing protein n=1 Tax=Temperatibacter marinus TaxID=1456591 RepID=A0AA52EIR7_9PROT|nr:DNA methyltransferase [Temperatibacter marinus]WND03903.1 hypothetical protein QGN29_05895 [Temperatibacter marinus]